MEDLPNKVKTHYLSLSFGPFVENLDVCLAFINKILDYEFELYKPRGINGYKFSMNDSVIKPFIKINDFDSGKISLLSIKKKFSSTKGDIWSKMGSELYCGDYENGFHRIHMHRCPKVDAERIAYSTVYLIVERLLELKALAGERRGGHIPVNLFKELVTLSLLFIPFETNFLTHVDEYDEVVFCAYSFLYRQFSVFNPYHNPIIDKQIRAD